MSVEPYYIRWTVYPLNSMSFWTVYVRWTLPVDQYMSVEQYIRWTLMSVEQTVFQFINMSVEPSLISVEPKCTLRTVCRLKNCLVLKM